MYTYTGSRFVKCPRVPHRHLCLSTWSQWVVLWSWGVMKSFGGGSMWADLSASYSTVLSHVPSLPHFIWKLFIPLSWLQTPQHPTQFSLCSCWSLKHYLSKQLDSIPLPRLQSLSHPVCSERTANACVCKANVQDSEFTWQILNLGAMVMTFQS